MGGSGSPSYNSQQRNLPVGESALMDMTPDDYGHQKLIVNTSPVGILANRGNSLDSHLVFDLVYHPRAVPHSSARIGGHLRVFQVGCCRRFLVDHRWTFSGRRCVPSWHSTSNLWRLETGLRENFSLFETQSRDSSKREQPQVAPRTTFICICRIQLFSYSQSDHAFCLA